MVSKIKTLFLIFIILAVTGCMNSPDNDQPQTFDRSSHSEPRQLAQNENVDPILESDSDENSNEELLDNTDTEEEPTDFDEIVHFDDPLENEEINRIVETEEDAGYEEHIASPLMINEFQDRWNAISDEWTLVNFITSIQTVVSNSDEPYYLASLDHDHLQIRLYTKGDHIKQIEVVETGTKKLDHLLMLTAWWQVMLMTNPVAQSSDIDTLFAEIGVGPDTNLSAVNKTTFTFGGLDYVIIPEKHFLFQVTYP